MRIFQRDIYKDKLVEKSLSLKKLRTAGLSLSFSTLIRTVKRALNDREMRLILQDHTPRAVMAANPMEAGRIQLLEDRTTTATLKRRGTRIKLRVSRKEIQLLEDQYILMHSLSQGDRMGLLVLRKGNQL